MSRFKRPLDAGVMQFYEHLSVLFLLFPGVGNIMGIPDSIISYELASIRRDCYNWASLWVLL